MSAADTPDKGLARLTDRELAAVDGVLKDMSENATEANITITVSRDVDAPIRDVGSPPAVFGAGGPMYATVLVSLSHSNVQYRLKQFDQSNAASRVMSQDSTPPRSVVGIGGKGMYYNHTQSLCC